jgi:hypothetical protein
VKKVLGTCAESSDARAGLESVVLSAIPCAPTGTARAASIASSIRADSGGRERFGRARILVIRITGRDSASGITKGGFGGKFRAARLDRRRHCSIAS